MNFSREEMLNNFFTEDIIGSFDCDDETIIAEQIRFIPKTGDVFIDADAGEKWTLENDAGNLWSVTNEKDSDNTERAVENWREVVFNYGPMVFVHSKK